jgi:hypothetical protein
MQVKLGNQSMAGTQANEAFAPTVNSAPSIARTSTDALRGNDDCGCNAKEQMRPSVVRWSNLGNGQWRINDVVVGGDNIDDAMGNWRRAIGAEPRPQ